MDKLGDAIKIRLQLTGGLGNQLFQFAFARSNFPNASIILDTDFGAPRRNAKNEVEISEFNLGPNTHVAQFVNESRFLSKVFGFNIRSAKHPEGIERNRLFQIAVRLATTVCFSWHYKKFGHIITERNSRGILTRIASTIYPIGYFQNASLVSGNKELVRSISLQSESKIFEETIKLKEKENILVIHIRRGDYRNEPTFGLVGLDYYAKAYELVLSQREITSIWLFSDEPDQAEKLLEQFNRFKIKVHVVPNKGLSSSETLELMRHGSSYIIGNSTFSWWGAFLCYSIDPLVVIPQPWFKSHPIDTSLKVTEWLSLPADFEDSQCQLR